MNAQYAKTTAPAAVVEKGGSRLADLIRRHPLVAYFTIAYALTWLTVLPLLLSGRALGFISLPEPLELTFFLLTTFIGPTPAAFIVTGIVEGKRGVKALLARMVQWRVGLRWYLFVLVGYLGLFVFGATLAQGPQTINTFFSNWPLILTAYLPMVPIGMIYPGLGEEPGWRGFALPRLQALYGPLAASLILGTLHALWHLPIYFIPGTILDGPFDLLAFSANSLSIVAFTYIWTWLSNNTANSILFAMFFHATSNAASGYLPNLLNSELTDQFFLFKLAAAVALVLVVATRGRLGYKQASRDAVATANLASAAR